MTKTARSHGYPGAGVLALSSLVGLVLGCSDTPANKPSGQSMAGSARTAVTERNNAPEITRVRFDPLNPKVDGVARAVVEASDPDGDALQFRYEWRINGGQVMSTDAMIQTTGLSKGDQLEVGVVATDGHSESERFVRAIAIGNRSPIVSFVGIVPESPAPGEILEAEVSAVDEDGDRLEYRYRWFVNGELVRDRGHSFDSESLVPGDMVQLKVAASDGTLVTRPTSSAPVRISQSGAPEITSQPGGLREDGEFLYALEAVDPEGDEPLTFELLESPEGMTIDAASGEIAWTPAPEQSGTFSVDVKVSDPYGAASAQRFELKVSRNSPAPPASTR